MLHVLAHIVVSSRSSKKGNRDANVCVLLLHDVLAT